MVCFQIIFQYNECQSIDIIFLHIFSGNSNLVYTIIRKRSVFHNLANLPHDHTSIKRSLQQGRSSSSHSRKSSTSKPNSNQETSGQSDSGDEATMEGSRPALPAEPGTLKATLPATPGI